MADFCLQCNLALMMGPHSDFDHFGRDGQITGADAKAGLGVFVLCEGCGPTRVDHRGRCIDTTCYRHGHIAPEAREVLRSAEAWLARRLGPLGGLYRLVDRFFGTPWEPGHWHHLRWQWYNWKERRAKKDPVNIRSKSCFVGIFDGEDDAAGVEAPREDDPRSAQAGMVRDEDQRPI